MITIWVVPLAVLVDQRRYNYNTQIREITDLSPLPLLIINLILSDNQLARAPLMEIQLG